MKICKGHIRISYFFIFCLKTRILYGWKICFIFPWSNKPLKQKGPKSEFIEVVTFPLWSLIIRTCSKKRLKWLLDGSGCEQHVRSSCPFVPGLSGGRGASAILHAECLQGCPAGGRSSWKQSLSGAQVLCFTLKTVEKKLAEECFQAQTDECLPPDFKKTLL